MTLNTCTLSPVLWMPPLSQGALVCPQGFAPHGQVRSRWDSPAVGFLWCRLRRLRPAPHPAEITASYKSPPALRDPSPGRATVQP